jgi:hypothetical protein
MSSGSGIKVFRGGRFEHSEFRTPSSEFVTLNGQPRSIILETPRRFLRGRIVLPAQGVLLRGFSRSEAAWRSLFL